MQVFEFLLLILIFVGIFFGILLLDKFFYNILGHSTGLLTKWYFNRSYNKWYEKNRF